MIDLHAHSTASDGDLSPAVLMDRAKEIGLSGMALTDHDTVDGLNEASRRAAEIDLTFVPGIELDIDFPSGQFHLLGLGLREWDVILQDFLEELQELRRDRNRRLIAKMRKGGMNINAKEMETFTAGKIVSRLHFAHWLVAVGRAKNIFDAFARWLGNDSPYYEPKERLGLEEVSPVIHACGGKTVLAHPLTLKLSWEQLGERLSLWREKGLDGVEAWHSSVNESVGRRLETMARERGLLVTGGSDYHGGIRPDRQLGLGGGNRHIPDEWLSPFVQ